MFYDEIVEKVAKLKATYGESDPMTLCEAMGIKLVRLHLGQKKNAIKGIYKEINRMRIISVNTDMPKVIQRIIIAHELGHAVIHRVHEVATFHDIGLFNECSQTEKEANIFAAELLLADADVMDALKQGATFFNVASELMVPAELLDFKARILKQKGYPLNELPLQAKNNFLKDMEVPENDDYHIS